MKSKLIHDAQGEKTFALIFETGDEAMSGLVEFAKANALGASHFTAIGAFRDVTLGYFDWESKEYQKIPVQRAGGGPLADRRRRSEGRRAEGSCPCRRRPVRRFDARRPSDRGARPTDPGSDPHRIARTSAEGNRRGVRPRPDPPLIARCTDPGGD